MKYWIIVLILLSCNGCATKALWEMMGDISKTERVNITTEQFKQYEQMAETNRLIEVEHSKGKVFIRFSAKTHGSGVAFVAILTPITLVIDIPLWILRKVILRKKTDSNNWKSN